MISVHCRIRKKLWFLERMSFKNQVTKQFIISYKSRNKNCFLVNEKCVETRHHNLLTPPLHFSLHNKISPATYSCNKGDRLQNE